MIWAWGVLPCDIWTALSVHSLGKSDNSWKTTPLPSTLQLCRLGMTLLETLHHSCLEKSIVLLSPSCGWACASNWVSASQDSIVSRGVTTCAGMTAHTVILAQTRVGFLTGGRKKSFLALFNWRKRMLVLRWLSPGLGHFALSWAHSI